MAWCRPMVVVLLFAMQVGTMPFRQSQAATVAPSGSAFGIIAFEAAHLKAPRLLGARFTVRWTRSPLPDEMIITVGGQTDEKGARVAAIQEVLELQPGSLTVQGSVVRVNTTWRGHPLRGDFLMGPTHETGNLNLQVGEGYYSVVAPYEMRSLTGSLTMLGMPSCAVELAGASLGSVVGGTKPNAADVTGPGWTRPVACRKA